MLPTTCHQFVALNGPKYLIAYLSCLIHAGNVLDTIRLDLVRSHESLLTATLVLLTLCSEASIEMRKDFGALNSFELLQKILSTKSYTSLILKNTLVLCSSMCVECPENRSRFCEVNGITVVTQYLQFHSIDPSETEAMILATIECIWGTVCGDSHFEEVFLGHQGIFKLLDLLEIGTNKIKRHTLGCLLDLLENPKV